jgi:hypothetical protein
MFSGGFQAAIGSSRPVDAGLLFGVVSFGDLRGLGGELGDENPEH